MADDLSSEISWSGMSETDQIMFSVLSNSDRTDMDRLPKISFSRNAPIGQIIEEEEERIQEVLPEPVMPVVGELNFMDTPEQPGPSEQPPERHTVVDTNDEYKQEVRETYDRREEENPARESEAAPPIATTADPSYFQYSANEDEELQKRSVLLDLQQLSSKNGVRLTKEWTMEDRLEDMLLEMRRHSLAQDEKSNVNMMRDGMQLLITGIEMVNDRVGLLDLEGWSTEACRNLDKHDADLARIYRKYWRRGRSNSPEMSIAMSLFGSMGMHHLRRTMSKSLVSRAQRELPARKKGSKAFKDDTDSSDDEAPPFKR